MAATTSRTTVATTPGARRTRRRTPEESSGRYAASSSIGPDSSPLTLDGPVAELVVSSPPTASPTSRNWSTEVGRSDRATDAGSILDRETSDRDAVRRRGFARTANCALTSSRAAARSLPTRYVSARMPLPISRRTATKNIPTVVAWASSTRIAASRSARCGRSPPPRA